MHKQGSDNIHIGKEGWNRRDITEMELTKNLSKYSLNLKIKRKRIR